jgi:hypothetical protein
METPPDDPLQDAERLRLESLAKANAILERNLDIADALVQIHDRDLVIEARVPRGANDRFSDARLKYLLKFLRNRGAVYSLLATDLESAKALKPVMEDFARATWWQLSGGVPIESIPPTSPFNKPLPTQIQRDKILKVARHYVMEGYRRVSELRKEVGQATETIKATRRGYRQEVKTWMRSAGIESQKQAARRLSVSIDILKSIMSNRGRARYSTETLREVLEKIGQKQAP